jgi:hypothetical protein
MIRGKWWAEMRDYFVMKGEEEMKFKTLFFGIVFSAVISLCCSCAEWQPVCRHDAVYAAIVVGEQHSVRFVHGNYRTQKHVRAQAKINGKWVWIEPGSGAIRIGKDDPWFCPTKIYSYKQYMTKVNQRIKCSDKIY